MTTLGKYELHEQLGKGGFGTVYRATDTSLDREVAIKVLHPQLMVDETFVERFKKEAKILATFEHPNIVTIYDMGEIDGRVFIVMRYLSGGSLQGRIQKEGSIPLDDSLKIMGQVCEGLQAAHEQGMVHRDLKPANILFDQRRNVVISDFGLAKVVQMSGASSSMGVVGTPAYRAPELWRGKPPAAAATDVYSLGCIFVEMLTGKVLFDGETPDEILTQHLIDGPNMTEELTSKVNSATRDFILKALDKDMVKRPENAQMFHSELLESSRTSSQQTAGVVDAKPEPTQVEVIPQKTAAKVNSDLMKFELAPGIEMEFVRIPAGEFLMGSDPKVDQDAEKDEIPQHVVDLDEYWIGKFPVTNEQYNQFLLECENSVVKGKWSPSGITGYENHPVKKINWEEANIFCKWLGEKSGLKIHLPTEAQWEKAARGNDGNIYPWESGLGDYSYANYGRTNNWTTSVNMYPDGHSPYGVFDMSGNVFEWINDWYDEEYYEQKINTNPTGPENGNEKVIRGGSYLSSADEIRCSYRDCLPPTDFDGEVGFRCVISI